MNADKKTPIRIWFYRCSSAFIGGHLQLLKRYYRQWWQRHGDGVRPVVLRYGARRHAAAIAHIASAEQLRIRVENLLVEAFFRHAELVALPGHRCKVAADQDEILRVMAAAQERDDGILPVAEVHPLETRMVEVHLIQSGVGAIQPVQLAHKALQLAVGLEFQQFPAYPLIVVPLFALADLLPHEQ